MIHGLLSVHQRAFMIFWNLFSWRWTNAENVSLGLPLKTRVNSGKNHLSDFFPLFVETRRQLFHTINVAVIKNTWKSAQICARFTCRDCRECGDCRDCGECGGSGDCGDCWDCRYCRDCLDCRHCKNCRDWRDCGNCRECGDSGDCKGLQGL